MKFDGPLPEFCYAVVKKNEFMRGLLKIAFAKGGYKLINWKQPAIVNREETKRACFIDISGLAKKDIGTGIQRVARNLTMALNALLRDEAKVFPVWADIGTQGYFLGRVEMEGERPVFHKTSEPLRPKEGDVFLGADHSAMISLAQGGYLKTLKKAGVALNFICHDILPVSHPEWFRAGDGEVEKAWLKKFAPMSRMICVSKAVQDELALWLAENRIIPGKAPVWVHNGYAREEFESSETCGDILPAGKFCLVVGTIEPRKGHSQVLSAFEEQWKVGSALKLVFVGKTGWKMASFCQELKKHPENGKLFFWLENCSDKELDVLYQKCDLFIMPSKGEGFGLPVIEALIHSKVVICRDLPVFREITENKALYFSGDSPAAINKAVSEAACKEIGMEKIKIASWRESGGKIWEFCNS